MCNKFKISFFCSLSIVLTLLYGVAIVPIHIHEHDHEDEIAHSIEIHETDACHNFIYHGDTNIGCANHDHATPVEVECLICHYFIASQQLKAHKADAITIGTSCDQTYSPHTHIYIVYTGHATLLRGPPCFA